MKKGTNRKTFLMLFLSFLLLFTSSGCGQISAESNYTLSGGKNIPGTLLLFSTNAILEEESSVDGSVMMLCCNLTIDGKVGGNVYLVSGNVRVGRGDVAGNIHVISGNVAR